jgi:hypothetical protein
MSISDISEFAAWEAEHRPLDEELDSQRKQRLREVRDAMDEEMVWKGQDSSNDERSEDSEGNNSEPEKLPSNSMVRRGSTEGENREKKTDVVARRMVVHALRIKIPLKTDEQRALDKALREKGMTQRQKRKDDDARVEIPSLTAPTQSDGEEDEEHPDFMAQPSSQPRPSSSPEEMGEDNDSEIIDQGEEEDPFEEFDIDPEQREFLLELLEAGVPAEEMKLLRTSTHLIVDENARTKTYFENAEKMHSNVVEFARTHPFWENKVAEELEMQEYMRDVYDYAKAAGMGKNRARVEVMRMNAAWRRDKCVDYSDRWDEDELEDVSELGMREQIVHEKEVKGLIQQTLKKLAVVEDGEVKAVQVLDLKDGKKSKKRKRAASNAVNDTDAPVRLAKRLRKELKKERRKKQRAENRMNGATGKRVSPHKGSAGPAHQMQRNKPVNTDSKPSSLATSPPKSRHERRKKIPKQGPTISAYFSQAGTSASSGVSKGGLGNMAHLADGFKPLWEGPSEMDRRRKTMEAEEKQTELKAELEELPLEATMPTNKTMASIGNVNGHTKTYPAEFNALGEDDVNRDSQKDDVSNNTAHEVDVQKKKHKRKKKRNHNRISEDQARLSLNEATNATDEKAAFSIDILESAAVCTEKDGRMNSFMDHLPQNERSIVIDTPDDHHDETKRSDRKKKKSKKDKVKKGRTRDVEHEARNASDPIAYPDSASTLKLKHEVQRKESKRKQESNAAESPPAEALTELADTNAKEPKVGRRDRGRKRKGGYAGMELDIEPSEEPPKALHS